MDAHELERKLRDLESDISGLRYTLNNLEDQISDVNSDLYDLNKEKDYLKAMLESLKRDQENPGREDWQWDGTFH